MLATCAQTGAMGGRRGAIRRDSSRPLHAGVFALALCLVSWFVEWLLAATGRFNAILAWVVVLSAVVSMACLTWAFVAGTGRALAGGGPAWMARLLVAGGLAACLGAYFVWFVHPPERVIPNSDQGSYSLQAVTIARTGSALMHSRVLAESSASFQSLLIQRRSMQAQRDVSGERRLDYYLGFFVADPARGELRSQFPSAYPTLLSCAFVVGGMPAMQHTNVFLLVLSSVVAGLLALRWFGGVGAVTLAGAAVLFPLHVWIGNSFYAEPAVMLGWLSALLALDRFRAASSTVHGDLYVALAAFGVALGIGAKIDGLAGLAVAALLLWQVGRAGTPFRRVSRVSLLVSVPAVGAWWAFSETTVYSKETLSSLLQVARGTPLWIAATGGAMIVLLGLLGCAAKSAGGSALVRGAWLVRYVVVACLVLVLGWYYFVRPQWAGTDRFFYWPYNAVIRSYREATLQRMGWYFSPAVLWVALAGSAWLCLRARRAAQAALVVVGFGVLLVFSHDLHNNPIQPYGMRRFLTFASPLLMFGIGQAVTWARRPRPLAAVVGVGVMGVVLAAFSSVDMRMNRVADAGGLLTQMQALVRTLPGDSIVITSSSSPIAELAAPLEHLCGATVIVLREPAAKDAEKSVLRQQLLAWSDAGRTLWLLSSGSYLPLGVAVRESPKTVVTGVIRVTQPAESVEKAPSGTAFREWRYRVCQVQVLE